MLGHCMEALSTALPVLHAIRAGESEAECPSRLTCHVQTKYLRRLHARNEDREYSRSLDDRTYTMMIC